MHKTIEIIIFFFFFVTFVELIHYVIGTYLYCNPMITIFNQPLNISTVDTHRYYA